MEEKILNTRRQLPKLFACLTKSSVEHIRDKLLFSVPTMTGGEIRRQKLAFHECIILELKESGFMEAAAYISDLIKQNLALIQSDDMSYVEDLTSNPVYLEWLKEGLTQAERAKDNDDPLTESQALGALAHRVSNAGRGLNWLAGRLYAAASASAQFARLDGGKQAAISYLDYSKFLLGVSPDTNRENAYDMLMKVKELSCGKSWTYEEETVTVFTECCLLLHGVLLREARALRTSSEHDPELKANVQRAERLCKLAERRAIDAESGCKLAEAVSEKGRCQLALGELKAAIHSLELALLIWRKEGYRERQCDAHIDYANALQSVGRKISAERNLTEAGAVAINNELDFELGKVLRCQGELYIHDGSPGKAVPYLEEAFRRFQGQRMPTKRYSSEFTLNPDNSVDTLLSTNFAPGTSTMTAAGDTAEVKDGGRRRSSRRKSSRKRSTGGGGRGDGSGRDVKPMLPVSVHREEAMETRIMCAIAKGQDMMANYYALLEECNTNATAIICLLKWKLHGRPFHIRPVEIIESTTTLLTALEEHAEVQSESLNRETIIEEDDDIFKDFRPKDEPLEVTKID